MKVWLALPPSSGDACDTDVEFTFPQDVLYDKKLSRNLSGTYFVHDY